MVVPRKIADDEFSCVVRCSPRLGSTRRRSGLGLPEHLTPRQRCFDGPLVPPTL
jgi:hypothetical protein